MQARKGYCINTGECQLADQKQGIFVAQGKPFVCPECLGFLESADVEASTPSVKSSKRSQMVAAPAREAKSLLPWFLGMIILLLMGLLFFLALNIFHQQSPLSSAQQTLMNKPESNQAPPPLSQQPVTAPPLPATISQQTTAAPSQPEVSLTSARNPLPSVATVEKSTPPVIAPVKPVPMEIPVPATSLPETTKVGLKTLPTKPPITIRIHGDLSPCQQMVPDLAVAYLKKLGAVSPDRMPSPEKILGGEETIVHGVIENNTQPIDIQIVARDTALAFTSLRDNQCDIGLAASPVKNAELEFLSSSGINSMRESEVENIVALDAVAIIVHPQNAFSRLTRAQIRDILAGRITEWPQLGGSPGRIHCYVGNEKEGSTRIIQNLILGQFPFGLTAKALSSSAEIVEQVCSDTQGFGYVPRTEIGQSKVVAIGDEGTGKSLLPTPFNVQSEDYLLSRRLVMYLPKENTNAKARDFVNFAMSPEGQDLIQSSKKYVVSKVSLEEAHPSEDALKTAGTKAPVTTNDYSQLVANAKRLSISFRFSSGNSNFDEKGLDNKAQRDLARVREFLKKNKSYTELLFVGFTDNAGSERDNLKISQLRANSIAHMFEQEGIHPTQVKGFGQQFPVASNDSLDGRMKNRRVEVWIR